MDLSSLFSDDQMAVIGCFVALSGCGLIALLSYRFGPAGRGSAKTYRTPMPVFPVRTPDTTRSQDRRAA